MMSPLKGNSKVLTEALLFLYCGHVFRRSVRWWQANGFVLSLADGYPARLQKQPLYYSPSLSNRMCPAVAPYPSVSVSDVDWYARWLIPFLSLPVCLPILCSVINLLNTSLSLSVSVCICVSVSSVCLCVCACLYPSICPSLSIVSDEWHSLSLSLFLSLNFCPSLCLSHFLCVYVSFYVRLYTSVLRSPCTYRWNSSAQ